VGSDSQHCCCTHTINPGSFSASFIRSQECVCDKILDKCFYIQLFRVIMTEFCRHNCMSSCACCSVTDTDSCSFFSLCDSAAYHCLYEYVLLFSACLFATARRDDQKKWKAEAGGCSKPWCNRIFAVTYCRWLWCPMLPSRHSVVLTLTVQCSWMLPVELNIARAVGRVVPMVPRHKLSSMGWRAFSVAALFWKITDYLHDLVLGLNSFRRQLKSFFFAHY